MYVHREHSIYIIHTEIRGLIYYSKRGKISFYIHTSIILTEKGGLCMYYSKREWRNRYESNDKIGLYIL
jgi:hypothetical protein